MIEQRTPAWLKQRVGRVTGSVVGAILGLDPNRTRADVLRAMIREALGAERETDQFAEDVIFAHGRFHEAGAIAEYEMEAGRPTVECGFFPYEDWLGASPDRLLAGSDGVLEVKAPWGKRKDAKPEFKRILSDELPHYFAQCQVEMLCTNRTWLHFFQWAPMATQLEEVDRDDEWLTLNVPRLRQFHAEYLDELANNPDDYLAPRRIEIDTPDAAKMVAEYDQLSEAIENATARKEELLAEMVALAGERNSRISGRALTKISKKGSVSYAKAFKALMPKADLKPYTGAPSEYWQLT